MKGIANLLGTTSVLILAMLFAACAVNVGDLEGEDTTTSRLTLLLRARAPVVDACPGSDSPEAECPGDDDGMDDGDDGVDDGDDGTPDEVDDDDDQADDPAGTIRAAVVTISGIYLQGGIATDSDDADEEGRVWLSQETRTTNLLTLSEDFAELVSEATVERGRYEQLRLIITDGYIEVVNEDGSTSIYASRDDYEGLPAGATVAGELRMPSFDTSGLKINLPDGAFNIEGEQKIVLLDFDIAESFGHEAGNSGAWVMHPVIDATDVMFTSTVEVEANLGANVSLPEGVALADINVRLEDADNTYLAYPLGQRDDDPAQEAVFEFINPLHNPNEIHFTSDLGLIITAEPALPYTFDVPSGEIFVLVFTIVEIRIPGEPLPTNVEVEAVLGEGVALPEVDGELVVMEEIEAVLTDANGNESGAFLANLDDDAAFEARFDDIDAEAGPYTIDFGSDLELAIETDPETPFSADVPAEETTTYSFTLTSVLGPGPALSNVEVEAILGQGVTMPTIDGEVVLMRDIKARLTDAQGNEMVLALTDLDADDAFEVIFEGVDPELGPYQIDFTSDLDLTLATDPSTPESVELEPGDSTYSYTLTSVTGPVAAAATLVVRLLFDESWEIDSDEVDCAMTNDDGATVTGNFIEVSGAWEVTFENLDPAKSWVIDLDEPSGVTVNTTPDLPYDVQLAEGQTTTIEFQVDSVTFDL